MEEKLLSVIVPVYNVELYLQRCLNSILNQTYDNIEVICIDDGSTDNSLDILNKYGKQDERIKVIHQDNKGLVNARKKGLAVASGEYVTYVDSDDWIECNMYSELMSIIEKEKADVITSGNIRDYGTHTVVESEKMPAGIYEKGKNINLFFYNMIDIEHFFCSNISVHIYNKIYKKNILKTYQNNVNDKINVGEDAACVYPVLLNSSKIIVSGKNYYHYCIRENSIMGAKKKDNYEKINILFKGLKKEFYSHKDEINNIEQQEANLELYYNLMQHVEDVVKYKDGILYPYGELSPDERVVIYGNGKFGKVLSSYLIKNKICNVVGIIDKNSDENIKDIRWLEKNKNNVDKVIIAVVLYSVTETIENDLKKIGIKKGIYRITGQLS